MDRYFIESIGTVRNSGYRLYDRRGGANKVAVIEDAEFAQRVCALLNADENSKTLLPWLINPQRGAERPPDWPEAGASVQTPLGDGSVLTTTIIGTAEVQKGSDE